MANGFGSLYIGASGLQNAQYAINTTANNLANVDTTGYVRQQVRFADNTYNTLKQAMGNVNLQQYGLGVTIGDVVHARDIFLDKAYRQEAGREAFYTTQYDTINYVEDLMQELNGEEFKESISDLCEAFQQLATQPEVDVYKNLVLQKAELFVSRTQDLYQDFQNYQSNLNDQIKDDVDRVNEIGQTIYDLNIQIQKIEAGGVETAMTLRDERDNLLDELATYGKVEISEDATNFTNVYFEDMLFVDDIRYYSIGMAKDKETGFYTPYWNHLTSDEEDPYVVFNTKEKIDTAINTDVGGIKSLLIARGDRYGTWEDLTEETDPETGKARYVNVIGDEYTLGSTMVEVEAELDQLFHNVITQINNLYAPKKALDDAGVTDKTTNITYTKDEWMELDLSKCSYGANGEVPEDLFVRNDSDNYIVVTDANDVTHYLYRKENEEINSTRYAIGNVSINSNYTRAVSTMPAYTENGATAIDFSSALRDLWNETEWSLNPSDKNKVTFEEYYNKMVNNLGVMGNVYQSASETLQVSVASYDSERQQVIGVSSDEELTKMIKYQAAYNAASRYMTVISEMTELIVTGLI